MAGRARGRCGFADLALAGGGRARLAWLLEHGGATWQPLSLPTREETLVFDASALPGGDRSLLELAVTDGFHTTRVQSKEYEVKPKGWILWILGRRQTRR